ncbi:SDR family NAD(P)-dependent oxidoreductase [Flavisolibacter ginsenosidimutans]|uniref:SDR family NAD(P)-dependent oxidoreductase n=1 Tax=Flavisolibacter ginsenosidimutans TaxID=661481 RepID=A0A5B8UKJ1_9BACT|nr:SDR family NAD(P)-dependent oxidoreductase [Flavisolibacter ginsenosidimutans]QEC56922.1 SDR family NAD(P)-dependent oxidoreductase [Flavisolibacter ginsenosidimutans]
MNKTVIITGATGNLGSAVTKKFLTEGYTVIATVTSEEAKKGLPPSDKLQAEIVNLTDENETENFVQRTIAQHRKIDAALLLVGGFAMGNIGATKGEDIKKQLALNFHTAYNVTRPLFAHMMENGEGRLVFIGSRPALNAAAGKNLIAYGLSKSLLFKLAEYLNEEAKGRNVTATVVAPSTIDTPLNRKDMPNANPDNWVKPEALADVLEFVVSGKSAPLRETVLKVYNNS